MPDRVREAIFSMLGSYYGTGGQLPPLHAADVFAGSGSMGLEALSRGAKTCHFFERDAAALEALRANLAALAVGPEGMVRAADAWRAPLADGPDAGFGLVFLDPPYADARDAGPGGRVGRWLACWAESAGPEALTVLHHEAAITYDDDPQGRWRVIRQRRFGSHAVTILVRNPDGEAWSATLPNDE